MKHISQSLSRLTRLSKKSIPHARPILERYRDQLLTFNDDIQGTAAVALGAILGAVKVAGKSLKDQQIVMLGAGSAGIGVADFLRAAMRADGLSEPEARSRFWVVDKDGLLHAGRTDLTAEQRVYAQSQDRVSAWPRTPKARIGLAEVIEAIDATILIGLSTVGGAFTEAIVREMARKVQRPIIFPLSNPTAKSEATAEELMRWTEGRALVATGSPFGRCGAEDQRGRTASASHGHAVESRVSIACGTTPATAVNKAACPLISVCP